MNYQVFILRSAQKSLAALPKVDYLRVRDAIAALSQHPRPVGCKKLVGRDGWRIRVGVYRVIYEIDDSRKLVTVLHVGHRRDAYS
jgi:mRNA interferase RelE/StbE